MTPSIFALYALGALCSLGVVGNGEAWEELAAGSDVFELEFRALEGRSIKKVFEVDASASLTELEIDGVPFNLGTPFDSALRVRVAVEDHHRRVQGRELVEFSRSFDELGAELTLDRKRDVLNPLLYRSLLFERIVPVEEGEHDSRLGTPADWRYRWDSQRLEEPVPQGLFADLDLLSLLPPRSMDADTASNGRRVSEGSAWEVPFADLGPVLVPSGDLYQRQGRPDGFGDEFYAWLAQVDFQEELELRFEGVERGAQGRLAYVRLDARWDDWVDLAAGPRAHGRTLGPIDVEGLVLDCDLAASGWLVWNLDQGHFESFELNLDLEFELDLTFEWSRSHRLRARGVADGVWTAKASRSTQGAAGELDSGRGGELGSVGRNDLVGTGGLAEEAHSDRH